MTKILFTGATGLLGKYFIGKNPSKYEIYGTYKSNSVIKKNYLKLDISYKKEVVSVIDKIKPDIVVHAASLSNVDYCETHKKEAHKVNILGTKNVLYACKKTNARIVFTSTNAVYDGNKPPYFEGSRKRPIDVYGKTKVEAESLVIKSKVPYVIVRLMTMYGWSQKGGRSNPVEWIIHELKNKNRINVVDDIFNNHLYAGQAADLIWKIIQKDIKNETYNIAGGQCVSRFDLAQQVAKIFNLDSSLINPVNSDFFSNIAKRPKNTCFNTSKIEHNFKLKPFDLDNGLRKMALENKSS